MEVADVAAGVVFLRLEVIIAAPNTLLEVFIGCNRYQTVPLTYSCRSDTNSASS